MSDNFVTGLIIGQGQADNSWRKYASRLKSELEKTQNNFIIREAHIAALNASLQALPPEVREMVQQSLAQNYFPAFYGAAAGITAAPEAVRQVAEISFNRIIQRLNPRSYSPQ